jgi:hypothetical protein
VGLCGIITLTTLGYMSNDVHKIEIRNITKDYENKIKFLNTEIDKLKLENSLIKINYKDTLKLKY